MDRIEFVSVGHTAIDTLIRADGQARTTIGGGGFSPTVTASTVLEGRKIGLISNIGDDDFGRKAIAYLEERGIDRQGLTIVPDGVTTWCVFMEFSPGNRRSVIDFGVSQNFQLSLPSNYKKAKYLHLGSAPSNQQLEWMVKLREFSPTTIYSVDPFEMLIPQHPEETKEVFRRADIIFLNELEIDLFNQLGGEIPEEKQIILKLGAKGVIYRYKDTRLEIPAPQVDVVHTTGAGEALAGVFLGLRCQNIPVEQALVKAVRYASLSVTDYGIQHLARTVELFKG